MAYLLVPGFFLIHVFKIFDSAILTFHPLHILGLSAKFDTTDHPCFDVFLLSVW